MPQRPNDPPEEGSPEYEWLYGPASGSADDDATRIMSGHSPLPGEPLSPQVPPPPAQPPRPVQQPGRGGGSGKPPARRPRRRFGWGKRIGIVLIIWLAFLIVVPILAVNDVSQVKAFPQGERPGDQPGNTYLLVGSDSREGLSKEDRKKLGTGNAAGRRTDTIMLLHTGSGPNLLMSIPRDSLVEIPGYGVSKINAAFAYDGPKLLIRTLENNTGIRIDDYIEIGFGGFVDVVDAVGGIEICPKQPLKDKDAKLNITKKELDKNGCLDADGAEALGYARTRKTQRLGDLDRAKNQREVISKIGDKVISPWSILNPIRYYQLNFAGAGSVRVSEDTGVVDLAKFAMAMRSVSGKNGKTCGVPIADQAVNWDRERSAQMFNKIIADDTESIGKKLCSPSGLPGQ